VKTPRRISRSTGIEVPAKSSALSSSQTFIWLVVDCDRHLVGLRVELGQHVERVVVQPLGVGAFAFGSERDRAADLQKHAGHCIAQPRQDLVEHRQALAAFAIGLAHVHV